MREPRSTSAGRSLLLVSGLMIGCGATLALHAQNHIDFNRDIQPILANHCFACHGPDENARKAKLRLDQREFALNSGKNGPAIIPGDSAKSALYQRIAASDEDDLMPPPKTNRPLSRQQKELLRQWIDAGASWGRHWAFVSPQRRPRPNVRNTRWPKNAIDYFILEQIEKAGLTPSIPASKPTLIRRLSLDLTGLPPTSAEINEFVTDQSSNAYEKLVDRLLHSPRYGERMVLDWLEAARYADSNGYQSDGDRAMWLWRDWAIGALNRNMPFDQFTVEQLAGDLLPNATMDQRIATGFNRNHMLNGEGGAIAEESRVGYVVDRLDTTSTVWLGLTVGCARCHDHKYDPISQSEYYQLYAFFNNVEETGSVDGQNNTARPIVEFPTDEQRQRRAVLEKENAQLEPEFKRMTDKLRASLPEWETAGLDGGETPSNIVAILRIEKATRSEKQRKQLEDYYFSTDPDYPPLKKRFDATKKSLSDVRKSILTTMVMQERAKPRDTFVLVRGAYDKHGEKVGPNVPAALPPLPSQLPHDRLGFAHWLVSASNPLTARVFVNRQWQLFFGAGLVRTPDDFGVQGERPSHPELLDWLATEFIGTAWNIKALQKLIVMSATYRQSAAVSAELLERDPENRLLSRAPRFRLDSHIIRDQALALSGLLVEKVGGPAVKPYQPVGVWEDFSYGKISYQPDAGEKLYRRSVYSFWRRSVAPPTLFDTAPRQVCNVRRPRTNTPLHALTLLNDVTFVEASRAFANTVLGRNTLMRCSPDTLFRAATCRSPSSRESEILDDAYERFLAYFRANPSAASALVAVGQYASRSAPDIAQTAAQTAVASLILNLDEVITRE